MVRSAPPKSEAEYVVVGSGSAGAALAGRLAMAGRSVILLEAGKHDNRFLVKKPGMIGPMHAEPRIKRTVDWGYHSTPQHHLLDRRMPVPQAFVPTLLAVGDARKADSTELAANPRARSAVLRVAEKLAAHGAGA